MKNNNKGFTLVEVICSVALLAIIITASSSFFTSVLHSQRGSKEQLYANNMAQQILETVTRSGNISEFNNRTYTKDGIDYYVEITATARPDVVSGGTNGNNGDDSDATIDKNMTFVKNTLPPEGTTAPSDPGTERVEGTIPGKPAKFNLRIDMIDFIDEDLPMLIAAGGILKDRTDITDAGLSEVDISNILLGADEFKPYVSSYSAGGEASNVKKASVCYRNLSRSVITQAYKQFQDYESAALSKFTERLSADFFHNAIHNGACPSPTSCEYTAKSQKMYDYFMNNPDGNPFHMIQEWYNVYQDVLETYDESEVISMFGDNSVMFNTLERRMVDRMSNNGLIHIFNATNMAKENKGTKTGPYLFSKLFDNNNKYVSYDFAHPTKLVDATSTVRFQIYPRYFNLYTFSDKPQWSWNETTPKDKIPLEAQVIDLPNQISYFDYATGKPVFGYQNNIINMLSFYVTGGLSYRDMTLTSDFYGGGYADHAYSEDGTYIKYGPSVNYFEYIDYGLEHYTFQVIDPNNYISFNKNPPILPDGGEGVPSVEEKPGTPGSIGTNRYNVTDEDVTTTLSFAIKGLECYTIKIRQNNSTGPIISELVSYGIPAKSTPTPDPNA